MQDPTTWVFHITEPIGNFIAPDRCCRCRSFLVEAPWFATLAGLTLIAFVVSGLRPAITTFAMLALIGVMGVWALAMDTLSQVLVATVLAVVIGVALGVWAAESNARLEGRCGRSTTCCRRCRSSSTSSRSST